jgi:hypothetical protein
MNHPHHRSRMRGFLLHASLAAVLLHRSAQAAFTVFDLPSLPAGGSYVAAASDNLADGRLIYGTRNSLYEQTTFGLAAVSPYSGIGSLTWDPSSVAIYDNTHGVVAKGNGASLYLFNPSDLGSSFDPIPGVSLQNFGVLYRDATNLLVVGTNGTGGVNAISSVKTDGTANKVIIDQAGAYSGPIALDLAGNLYVTNAENGNLYMFTPEEVAAAITTPVNLSAGHLITNVRRTGSLALDALGRIITGGYDFSSFGFDVYDPATHRTETYAPAGQNNDYLVTTFSDGTNSYIGFLDAGYTPGGSAKYGYDLVSNVPEPVSGLLLLAGAIIPGFVRRRHVAAI